MSGADEQPDRRLLAALRHAPDHDLAPPPALDEHIRRQAHAALATAPAATNTTRAGVRHPMWDAMARGLAWLVQPAPGAALATLVLGTTITLMWRDGPPPDALPEPPPIATQRSAASSTPQPAALAASPAVARVSPKSAPPPASPAPPAPPAPPALSARSAPAATPGQAGAAAESALTSPPAAPAVPPTIASSERSAESPRGFRPQPSAESRPAEVPEAPEARSRADLARADVKRDAAIANKASAVKPGESLASRLPEGLAAAMALDGAVPRALRTLASQPAVRDAWSSAWTAVQARPETGDLLLRQLDGLPIGHLRLQPGGLLWMPAASPGTAMRLDLPDAALGPLRQAAEAAERVGPR